MMKRAAILSVLFALSMIVSGIIILDTNHLQANHLQAKPFIASSANVEFTESGLPSGATWTVTMFGMDPYNEPVTLSDSSSGTTITQDGTYAQGTILQYSVSYASSGAHSYTPSPMQGSLTLASTNTIPVTYSTTNGYVFTISIQGTLATNLYESYWTGFITNNLSIHYSIKSSSITFTALLPNGTYFYKINGSLPDFPASNPEGYFSIMGTNYTLTEVCNYEPANTLIPISFGENGLPANESWNLTVNGTTYHLNTTGYVLLLLSQHSYNVTATAQGYTFEGPFSIYAGGYNENYNLKFTQNGSSGSLTEYLTLVLATIGLTPTGFWNILFLGISGLWAFISYYRVAKKDILVAAAGGVLLTWMGYVFSLVSLWLPMLLSAFGIAAFFMQKYKPQQEDIDE